MPERPDVNTLRDIAVRVGVMMNEAGDSVDSVQAALQRIFAAHGLTDAEVFALPTAVIIRTGDGAEAQVSFRANVNFDLRLDQVSALYALIDRLEAGWSDFNAARHELEAIAASHPPSDWVVRVFGHGLMTLGFALLIQPTPPTLMICFLLGLLVGALKLVRLPTLQLVFPVAVGFLVTVIVLVANDHFGFDNPIRILIPPIVTYLPGAVITIGTMELAANQVVAGASRLIYGLVQLLLLAFGVIGATVMVGVPLTDLSDDPARIGGWAPWAGVVVFVVGMALNYCAPRRWIAWMFVVSFVAYAGQRAGASIFDPQLSAFVGALLMTPVVLFFDQLRKGPPKLITFLPGFWLLVPGAAGLMAVVGLGMDDGLQALASVFITVVAIALGVLTGAAVFQTVRATRRLSRRVAR